MPYDDVLAARIRSAFEGKPGVTERKMFGGLAFMVSGNMACGVTGDEIMVRVGPDNHEDALSRPHARPMDFTGRPMRGMVYVARPGFESDQDLAAWVESGASFARGLPPK